MASFALRVFRRVKDRHNLLHCSPSLKKTCNRQVVDPTVLLLLLLLVLLVVVVVVVVAVVVAVVLVVVVVVVVVVVDKRFPLSAAVLVHARAHVAVGRGHVHAFTI